MLNPQSPLSEPLPGDSEALPAVLAAESAATAGPGVAYASGRRRGHTSTARLHPEERRRAVAELLARGVRRYLEASPVSVLPSASQRGLSQPTIPS
jgi:hypothetical protein